MERTKQNISRYSRSDGDAVVLRLQVTVRRYALFGDYESEPIKKTKV